MWEDDKKNHWWTLKIKYISYMSLILSVKIWDWKLTLFEFEIERLILRVRYNRET